MVTNVYGYGMRVVGGYDQSSISNCSNVPALIFNQCVQFNIENQRISKLENLKTT